MTTLDGPQWKQLPLLMTHPEVSDLFSLEHAVKVPEIKKTYREGRGNAGSASRELGHVDEIADRIKSEGYDDRFPLQLQPNRTLGKPDLLLNGSHRAAAVDQIQHPLTPVVYHDNPHIGTYYREWYKQDSEDAKDRDSGKKTMKHFDYKNRLPEPL